MAMENVEDIYNLSPIQSGMLFHAISEPDSDVYFGQLSCTLLYSKEPNQTLNKELFQQAWQQVVARHSVLRTIFLWENVKEPLQIVRQQVELPWQIFDWQHLSASEQQVALENFLETDRKQGFELTQAPLLRLALIQLTQDRTQFVLSTHHLLLDGWSTALVMNEVITTYENLLGNASVSLEEARPYSEYIAWTQDQESQNLEQAEAFWKNNLSGFTEPTVLPIQNKTSDIADSSGYSDQHLTLSKETTAALQEVAQSNRLTMSTLIQGAWSILLSRYTHQKDIIFGVTMAGRPADLADVDKRVGLFINTLPARVKLLPDQSLRDLLLTLQLQQAELREYESTPLVKVQQWSDLSAGQSLFDTLVVFENYPVLSGSTSDKRDKESSLMIENTNFTEHSNYPLSLLIFPDQQHLHFKMVYDNALFSNDVIERLFGHLQALLTRMTTGLDKSVKEIDILTSQERQQLIEWNNTAVNYGANQHDNTCIHHLVEAHSQSQTTAVVSANNQSLSYAELHQCANTLAHHLQDLGVKSGALVGLCLHRSVEMIIGLLGILKAGGAYVPLDPTYPSERLALMLSDFTNAETILVTETSLLQQLSGFKAQVVCIDTVLVSEEEQPAISLENHGSDDPAYMIYTSGSTGKPKGVLVSHQNLVHSTLAREHYYSEDLHAFLLLSSFAFDSSIAGIFWSLCQGKTLVLPEPDQEKDIGALASLIQKHRVSHTLCVPSLYQLFLTYADTEQLNSLSTVIVAGEACSKELVEQHDRTLPNTTLYNEYGPTEATVWSTVSQLKPSQPISIGKPISNTQIYILDEQLNPVPIGVAGEIYIGGDGVTSGYYNQPEATAASFISDPFSSLSTSKCYRTGDLARYHSDGHIEFLGRVDQQIKLHGYRIELGEIETVLKQNTDVLDALVVANNEQLSAYVITNQFVSADELETRLAQQLPDYMQPNRMILLDEFPLLPNGKVDHQALSELEPEELPQESITGFVPPRNETEQTLATIWADVLGMDSISIYDHFLQIGGDSILSIQMIARARQAGLYFTPKDLFEHPEIASLAEVVETQIESTSDKTKSQAPIEGEAALTPIQHWFFDTIKPVPQHWSQAVQLSISNELTASQIQEAIQHLCLHHDALRMRFTASAQGWEQYNQGEDFQLPWHEWDLSSFPPDQQADKIEDKANELQAQLDFSSSSLQIAFFQLGNSNGNRLVIISHHLIIDHLSWSILFEDLEQLCQQLIRHQSRKQPLQLPEKTLSYQEWAKQLMADAESTESTDQLSQWQNFLQIPAARLPVDFSENEKNNREKAHRIYTTSLDQELTTALLQKVPSTYQTKINDVLLTALLQTLQDLTGDASWLIDMELHGRDRDEIDVSRTIGWFTRFFPVALQANETEIGALLKSVKEQIRSIPDNGQSYGVLRYLSANSSANNSANSDLANLPQADLLFNYLGQLPQALATSAKLCNLLPYAKSGHARSPLNQRSHLLEINVIIIEGELKTNWSYSDALYHPSTIENLAQTYIQKLQALIEHCQHPEAGGFTPSDFADSGLDQNQLDQFIDSIT